MHVQIWVSMRLSDEEKEEFSPAFKEIYTDDSLQLHEEEIKMCSARLELMAPLIKMVERRETIRGKTAKHFLISFSPYLDPGPVPVSFQR